MFECFKNRLRVTVVGLVCAAAPAAATLAQFTPEDMDPVVFPLTPVSIGTGIATAGAVILGIVFTWRAAFRLITKLLHRLINSV